MTAQRLSENFRCYFWDANFDRLDTIEHAHFIAERLMEKTTTEALRWLLANYAADELAAIAAASRRLPARDKNFWRLYLHAS